MKQFFTLPLRLPDFNEYDNAARSHWAKAATLKKENTEAACWMIKNKVKPITAAHFRFTWIEPKTGRGRDPDNIAGIGQKIIFDALQMAGILANDGRKQVLSIHHDFKTGERYEVIVEMED